MCLPIGNWVIVSYIMPVAWRVGNHFLYRVRDLLFLYWNLLYYLYWDTDFNLDLVYHRNLYLFVEFYLSWYLLGNYFCDFCRHLNLSINLHDFGHLHLHIVGHDYWDPCNVMFLVLDGLGDLCRDLNYLRPLLNSGYFILFGHFYLLEYLHILVVDTMWCTVTHGIDTPTVGVSSAGAASHVAGAVIHWLKPMVISLLHQSGALYIPDCLFLDLVLYENNFIPVDVLFDHPDFRTLPPLVSPHLSLDRSYL